MLAATGKQRYDEPRCSAHDRAALHRLLYRHAGITLHDARGRPLQGRLAQRLRTLGLADYRDYVDLLASPAGERELVHFISAMTTNLTAFFREPHHFDFLAGELLPQALHGNAGHRRLRLWSAGCSTGEEAWSMAMVVRESPTALSDPDIRILATDVDAEALAHARCGSYDAKRIAGLSRARTCRWFRPCAQDPRRRVQVDGSLRRLIDFEALNLVSDWSLSGHFDLIACRNVLIYFDRATRRRIFEQFADALNDGGYLLLGRSESPLDTSRRFEAVGRGIYRKLR
jgi:chemotaxis protein methyltransferase CheR